MADTAAFLSPWQVAEVAADGADGGTGGGAGWLLRYLPRWLQGPITRDLALAIGRQLEAIDALALADQLFVRTATWGLAWEWAQPDGSAIPTGWERDYGIPVAVADGYAARRQRVLAKMQGGAARTAADFARLVQALLIPPATCPPTVIPTAGAWVVFKLCDRGMPANFADVEAALAAAGPAHLGLWLAAHREAPDTGLTDAQVDLQHGEALDVLTDAEWDGG